jgi:hypothetical protein
MGEGDMIKQLRLFGHIARLSPGACELLSYALAGQKPGLSGMECVLLLNHLHLRMGVSLHPHYLCLCLNIPFMSLSLPQGSLS